MKRTCLAMILPALLAALLAAAPAFAAQGEGYDGPDLLERGKEEYQAARFAEAGEYLRLAVERADLSPAQRADTWFHLGLSYLAQRHDTLAVQSFAAARQAAPAFQPAEELSPRARELWRLSEPNPKPGLPPAPAPAARPAQAPAPAPRQAAQGEPSPERPSFRETPLHDPQPGVSDLQVALDVRGGRPVGAAAVFAPQVRIIHLWFAMQGLEPGARLRAVWTHLGPPPTEILASEMELTRPGTWGQFSCEMPPGRNWPAGRYEVELSLDGRPAGRAGFSVP